MKEIPVREETAGEKDLVSLKLLGLISIVFAFVSVGGLEISRNAVSQASKLKDEVKESTSEFRESSKSGGKQ